MQLLFIVNRAVVCFLLFFIFSASAGKRHVLSIRNRAMLRRMGITREELKPKVCFDYVGCFVDPPAHLPLKRPPEHPNIIQTRFLLYTRAEYHSPESLEYGDGFRSIRKSRFNATLPLKVVIHGFKGSGSDLGIIYLAQNLLNLENTNVLILDWTRGAATTYSAAVANTELIGRQLALVLLDTINLGIDPKDVYIIGFSLGAHIAGCASEVLKKRNILLGRITGLDPASPFFRNHLFREKSRKLDVSDARLVDVIHTDGSEDFTDGFGLLKPLGHIDFFPNGGREQPGCNDVKNSVVVSHLKEEALTKELACSHLKAIFFYIESVSARNSPCKFVAWSCSQRSTSFIRGTCFPMETTEWSQEMGYAANRGPLGIYYLATRGEEPYCGQPVRASVRTSDGAPKTLGILFIKIHQSNSTTIFRIRCVLPKWKNDLTMFYNIAAVEFESLSSNVTTIRASIWYERIIENTEENTTKDYESDTLFLNKLAIEDRRGNRWEYCDPDGAVNMQQIIIELRNGRCTPA